MRREPHPISGVVYEEVGDGLVRVDDVERNRSGTFRWDGTWIEGDITHADPHLLVYVGGPDLPPGKDVYCAIMPPVDDPEESPMGGSSGMPQMPKIIAPYIGDTGMDTPEGPRSAAHIPLEFFLENERSPEKLPDIYRRNVPFPGGPQKVSTARYFEQKYHDLEVEKLWKKTWQMVCREDDIPGVGDYYLYEIASLSFLIVRTAPDEIKAHVNACLHRGRTLRECSGKKAVDFRCPFHGWTWNIDGSVKHITTEWDWPGVREDVSQLPGAKLATWGGFVFINPDPDAISFEEHMGPEMIEQYRKTKLQNRYKQAHVVKVMKANWKATQEAFLEGYHTIATHPQLMLGGTDLSDVRYDVFGNFSRMGNISLTISRPQSGLIPSKEQALDALRQTADFYREYLRGIIGDEIEDYADIELIEQTFNTLYPNFCPWGGWGRVTYRFRPNGNNPNECLMDVMLLAPWPEGKPKPPPRETRYLGAEDSWTLAPELGNLARIFDQDCGNVPNVQRGMQTKQPPYIWLSSYQESVIRNFHQIYDRQLGLDEQE